MFLNAIDTDFHVRQEQYKDLLREAQQWRLIDQQAVNKVSIWRVTNRIGAELIKWGSKLLSFDPDHQQILRKVKGELR